MFGFGFGYGIQTQINHAAFNSIGSIVATRQRVGSRRGAHGCARGGVAAPRKATPRSEETGHNI
jgi:hypothetical protein